VPKTASLNIRIDPTIKQSCEALFSMFGLTLADAVNIFFHQSLIAGGIPFMLKTPQLNAETIAALNEPPSSMKLFHSVDEMMEDILSDEED
jgi:DNA-damage-inducible protein J